MRSNDWCAHPSAMLPGCQEPRNQRKETNDELTARQYLWVIERLMSSNDLAALDAFNQHGKGMVSLRYGQLIRPNPDVGPLNVVADKGQIMIINMSDKYLEAKAKLAPFATSVELPETVTSSVAAFSDTLQVNLDLLMDTLNQDLRENPNLKIHDDDPTSPYYDSGSNRYWSRFQPLQTESRQNGCGDQGVFKDRLAASRASWTRIRASRG